MRFVIVPLFLLLTAAPVFAQGGDDFSRLGRAINREITLVEADGTVRQGVLQEVTADQASVRFGSGVTTFSRQRIVSVESIRDSSRDGAIKGAIFGGLLGLVTLAYPEGTPGARMWIGSIVVYSGIGFALDAAQTHRETLYRSRAAQAQPPKTSVSLSFRF